MPIPAYIPNYPPDGSSLGQTKAVIRNNLDGTFQTLGVDHIDNNGDPGANPAGYHNVIHCVPQASDPAAIAGFGQLYCKTITPFVSDTALFWETGTGLVTQLTSNVVPTINTNNGYTFLPGGIIFQWGVVNAPGTSGTVLFTTANIDFPMNLFNVQLTATRTAGFGGNPTAGVCVIDGNSTFDKTTFSYLCSTGSNTNLYWTAIGN